MASLRNRARAALAARLRSLLGPSRMHPGGEHALRFEDALVPTVAPRDAAWAHAQLALRAKGELRPAGSGAVPAHAAWSSAALVCSAFAPWREAGLADVRLEERLHIPHGGGTPNLDVVLEAPGAFTGIESKLTEHLEPRAPRPWRPAYRRPAMLAALDGSWAEVFAALLERRWAPRYLDAGQLVRHALSLSSRRDARLVLLFWEPGGEHAEVAAHRDEVAELLARLGPGAFPPLHALTYAALLDAWAPLVPAHVAALRARYDVAVRPAPRP